VFEENARRGVQPIRLATVTNQQVNRGLGDRIRTAGSKLRILRSASGVGVPVALLGGRSASLRSTTWLNAPNQTACSNRARSHPYRFFRLAHPLPATHDREHSKQKSKAGRLPMTHRFRGWVLAAQLAKLSASDGMVFVFGESENLVRGAISVRVRP
jgi:hypothetical protein